MRTRKELDEYYGKKREALRERLLEAKALGFAVFLTKAGEFPDIPYGLISDGTDVLYVQDMDGGGWDGENLYYVAYEYVPSRQNGSGCAVTEPGEGYVCFTKEMFDECVNIGRRKAASFGAVRYRNLEQAFRTDSWRREHYEKL